MACMKVVVLVAVAAWLTCKLIDL